MNTRQQEKDRLVKYTERLNKYRIIVKISIGEDNLDSFVGTTEEFKKLDKVDDAEEIIKMKKKNFKHDQRWFS